MSRSDTDSISDNALNRDFHVVPDSYETEDNRDSEDQPLLEDQEGEKGEEEEEEELPPVEWHPAVLFIGRTIKTVLSPIFKLIFAPQAQRAMVKTFVISIVVTWIILTSFTAYITFYQRYIPKNAHVEPIYFDYTNPSVPQGFVTITGSDPTRPLRGEQGYDISVQLHVPTSDVNFNIGNFMVNVELLSNTGIVLLKSSRPSILRYQSNSQRILHVLAKALPLLVGWTEESQVIDVVLHENFIENQVTPLTQARVTLSTLDLQVYDAHLSVVANFRGLRYYMYHRKVTTAIIFILLFTVIEIIFAMAAWKIFGKNLWDKLHEAFTIEELIEDDVLEKTSQDNSDAEEEVNDEDYITDE